FRAIFSLIGKVITAPFNMLAGLFGEAEQDISFVAFVPGTTTFAEGEIAKLDTLGRGLNARAGLSLDIIGESGPTADLEALRSILLREEMLAQLRQAAPTLSRVSDDLYRQGILTRYAALPPEARLPDPDPDFEA